MRTPQDVAEAGRSDPALVGRTLTTTLLQARTTLPHAANGRPLAPNSDYVKQVRKEMSQERSQEFKRLWAVCQCDLADGVPLPLVTAALRQMLTLLEVESAVQVAERRESTPRVLPILLRKETRKQGELDIAQLRALEMPECPNTLAAALFAGEHYLAAYHEWASALSTILHRIRHTSRPAGIMRIAR
jgi:hypothetical protein